MSGDCNFLFVYGTLRQASQAPMSQVLASHSEYMDEGTIQAKLFDVGEYPAVVLSSNKNDTVIGEVFKINNSALLDQLDEYEGCSESDKQPHEYKRIKATAKLSNGKTVEAWIYAFNQSTDSLHLIESGDYMSYLGISITA